jgi:hypothetical protein
MHKEIKTTDVSDLPDLLTLAEEVESTGTPQLLTRGPRRLAVLTPVGAPPLAARRRRTRSTSPEDPLREIVGMADPYLTADGPTDVAENVDRYLAEEPDRTHQ